MSTKSKFASLIMSFCLVVGLLVVGVFALKTANFEVGGNIVYNVNGVQMTIEKMELNNLTVADEASKMQKVEVDNETTKAEMQTMFDTWKGLSLASTGEDGEVSIVIRITNIAPEENGKKIAVNVSVDVAEEGKNNCDVVVTNLNGETSTVIAPQQYADFKIAFVPEDDGFQGNINNFVVNFDISRANCSVVVNDEALGTCSVVQSSEGAVFTATPTGTSTYVGLRNTATGKWVDINTPGVEESAAADLLNSSAHFQDYFINNSSLRGDNELMDRIGWILHDESVAEELATYESRLPGLTEVLTEIHNGNFTYQDSNANGEYEAVFTNATQKQTITVDDCTYTIYPDAKVAVLTATTKTGEVEISSAVTHEETTYDVIATMTDLSSSDESGAPTPVFTGDGITKVTLPNSITSVGTGTFENCSDLNEVVLGDNVTSIGYMAFGGMNNGNCANLAKLTINTIKPCAQGSEYFYTESSGEASLGFPTTTEIYVPSEAYFDYADAWSIYAGQIVVPEGVEVIAQLAYNYDDNSRTAEVKMASFTTARCKAIVPETVEHNGQNYTVTAVANYGFFDSNQFSADMSAGKITDISQMFNYGAKIYSIVLPLSVTSIGEYAFYGCSGLTSIELPNNLTTIGKNAFSGCGFANVEIPSKVTSIGDSAFSSCSRLESITVAGGNTVYDSRNNCNAIIKTLDNELITGCKNTVIPSTVTSIGGLAFYGCTGLTTITIPETVTSIGLAAFMECSELVSISLPSGLTSISTQTFERCSKLTSIVIPNEVTSIGESAFQNCSELISVTIGSKVASIDSQAFYLCSKLTTVIIESETAANTLATSDAGFLFHNESLTTLYFNENIWTNNSEFVLSGFSNFTQAGSSDREGYRMYTKNA